MLTLTTGFLTALVYYNDQLSWLLVVGLILFGALFAMNSSIHSYLIVRYSNAENVSMDVGFYYMANAMGRLIGTVLSGLLFQQFGLIACLIASTVFLFLASLISIKLVKLQL